MAWLPRQLRTGTSKFHTTDEDRKAAAESEELARLSAENREPPQENEFLK